MASSKQNQFQVAAFLQDSQDIEIVREALKGLNIKNNDVNKGGIKEAIDFFSRKKSPQFLIIDVSKSEMPVSDISQLSDLCDPGVRVIAIGTRNDVGLYRELMKLGISDYLVSPLFPDILGRSLQTLLFGESKDKKATSRFGKIITFIGSRGGVGSTLLATNFAVLISKEKARRVVVVDLDLHYGTVSLYFDLKSNNGLRDALENPDRMDSLFIERLLIPVNDKLSMLSSEEDLDEQIKYKIEAIDVLLDYLSKQFHYIILDVSHSSNNITQKVISIAHIMILITDASLAGLRDVGRIIRLFGEEEAEHKVVLVMNKFGIYEKGEVTVSDFESTLKRKINYVLPFDKNAPMESVNKGKVLVEGDSSLGNSIRELVNNVIGGKKSEEQLNWFSRIFRKEN